jgi:hypothetical protein
MKVKRLIVFVLILALSGTATAFSSDIYEWYKGKNVKIMVNGEELDTQGVMIQFENEVKTMLPLRDIANTLQAMVKWDEEEQTVHLYKPNVHISLTTQFKDGTLGTFGKVFHRQKFDFFIFAQIDSLLTPIESLKFEIVDPLGRMVYEHEHLLSRQETGDVLWVRSPNINLEFRQLGDYIVKVYMKLDKNNNYDLVSEKVFNSEGR